MSRDPFLQVLVSVMVLKRGVLVLEPQSLGLGTLESRSLSLMKREIETK